MPPVRQSSVRSSSFRDRLAKRVSHYCEEDRNPLIAFRRSVSQSDSVEWVSDCLRWQFEANPRTAGEAPQIRLYRADGHIVGQQCGIPVELEIGSRPCAASWAVDLHVEPKYRLRGIGPVLTEAYVKDNAVTMAMGITDDACRAFLKAGWIDLETVPLFVRPLNVGRMLSARWHRGLGRWLGAACNFPLRMVDLFNRLVQGRSAVRLAEVRRFDERIDKLWRCAGPHYPVICRRDAKHLNWRFADYPRRGCYRLHYCLCRNDVIGYVVLRMGVSHGALAGYIVDYLCEPVWTTRIFTACLTRLRGWGAAAAYCLHQAPGAAGALRKLGFVRRESETRLMVNAKHIDDDALELLRDRDNWFVTGGDSDVDRPRG